MLVLEATRVIARVEHEARARGAFGAARRAARGRGSADKVAQVVALVSRLGLLRVLVARVALSSKRVRAACVGGRHEHDTQDRVARAKRRRVDDGGAREAHPHARAPSVDGERRRAALLLDVELGDPGGEVGLEVCAREGFGAITFPREPPPRRDSQSTTTSRRAPSTTSNARVSRATSPVPS